jgi:two-component system cell cycle sensor histidine kinase/response regulator CckA
MASGSQHPGPNLSAGHPHSGGAGGPSAADAKLTDSHAPEPAGTTESPEAEPAPSLAFRQLRELPGDTLGDLLEHAADAVLLLEGTAHPRITWANRGGSDVLRRRADEIVGASLVDLLWDADELTRRPFDLERRPPNAASPSVRAMRAGDGGRLVVEITTRAIDERRWIAFMRDVTGRVEAQDRLIRSEASFRALIERSPDGIVVHREGLVVYANSAAARILGIDSPSELVGLRALEIIHPDDRARVGERISTMLAGEPSVPFSEERLMRRDGTFVVASVAALRVEFGGELSIAVIARDITEQRRMIAQLAQAERLASIGVLAAGVGHEINNPLTYVILRLGAAAGLERRLRSSLERVESDLVALLGEAGGRELLGSDLSASILDDLATHLGSAQDGAGRIRQIVSDLRLFSRVTDDALVPLDVRVPLERALAMASHELKHRAQIFRSLSPSPLVLANEGRLAQVFLNLLLNAAQAIAEGAPYQHEVHVSTRADGGFVVVEIRDTGEGIPEDVLPRLFEPFFTTKPVGAGSGLGLAVSHGIVVALGGRIDVTSTVGVGSSFRVLLPATAAPFTLAPPSSPRGGVGPARPLRILVVDDELSLARAVAMLLERHGEVVVESSGERAFERLSTGEAFDVVLCDIVMPLMSGFELFKLIQAHRPELADKVAFMSGGRLGEAERDHAERHPDRWLSKPFDAESLEACVARVLRRTRTDA